MSYTPGPWALEYEPEEWNSGGGDGVTSVVAVNAPRFRGTICANSRYYPTAPSPEDMRLIAAAPEMYEAIRAYIEERSGDADELMRAVWAKVEFK